MRPGGARKHQWTPYTDAPAGELSRPHTRGVKSSQAASVACALKSYVCPTWESPPAGAATNTVLADIKCLLEMWARNPT